MKIGFSAADEAFRQEVAQWLAEHLSGEFAALPPNRPGARNRPST